MYRLNGTMLTLSQHHCIAIAALVFAGHGWRSDLSIAGKENANSPDSHSPARRPFEGLRVNVEL